MSAIRKITADMPLDDVEDEVFFTCATIKADPDAADLLYITIDWLDLVDAVRVKDRQARMAETDATAVRVVANYHLDRGCTGFGDDLYLAVEKNRESARWNQFFSMTVSRFVKMRFDKQVQKVKSWLDPNVKDPILDKHRTTLTTWCNASASSIDQTMGVAMIRGAARVAREQLAEDITRERDGLYDALSARGREKGLPRDWPKQFFRVNRRKSSGGGDDDTENVEQTGGGT